MTFRLRGLDPSARYDVRNFDADGRVSIAGAQTLTATGKELMAKGLSVEIKDAPFEKPPSSKEHDMRPVTAPGAALVMYKRLK